MTHVLDEQVLELLIATGHMARADRHFQQARYLFECLQLAYPARTFPHLGLALVEIDCGNYHKAAHHCRSALAHDPDNGLTLAWLAVCQLSLGQAQAAAITFTAAHHASNPDRSGLATAFLGLVSAGSRSQQDTSAPITSRLLQARATR